MYASYAGSGGTLLAGRRRTFYSYAGTGRPFGANTDKTRRAADTPGLIAKTCFLYWGGECITSKTPSRPSELHEAVGHEERTRGSVATQKFLCTEVPVSELVAV